MANKNGNTNTNSQPPKMPQPPMRNIDFQVDTVSVERANNTGAYQNHETNSITSNFIKENNEWNEWAQGDNILIHEQKHRDNNNQGLFEYPVSPEQAYKLEMYDEISANMASLLLLRQKYLETGDISIFDKTEQGRFSFYKEAIEKGEINPRSNTKEDFDKEMRLIANGTKDMWMQEFAETELYRDCGASSAVSYGDMTGKYAQYYDQNYERGKKIALTIGGVDFTQYLDNDVEIPEVGRKQLREYLIGNENYKPAEDVKKLSNQDLAKKYNIPAYDGSMSLQQYQDYLQHYLLCQDQKYTLHYLGVGKLATDKEGLLDQSKAINDAKNNGFNYIKANEELITAAVTTAAQDYAKKGDKLPEANDEAYNKAVDKLYEIEIDDGKNKRKVNIRQDLGLYDKDFEDNLPITNLPDNAKKIVSENSDFWTRMKNKCKNAWNSVKDIFSSDKDENVIKNEVTNPVDKNKTPEYRQWANEDGSRVSEVQHRELPDMTKDIIRKPGKQVSAEQQSYSYTAQTKTTAATKQSYTAQADVKNASPQTSQNQSVKARMKQAAASRAATKPKPQKLNKPLKQQMSEDAKKYQTQKKVRRQQQQKTTAPRYYNTVKNDSIPTRQQIAPAMKIMQLRGVERSTPAKRVVKREVSGSIRTRRQLTND